LFSELWVQTLVDGDWRDFDASLPENGPGARLAEPAAVSVDVSVETAHQ
jgi:hypothetical protein